MLADAQTHVAGGWSLPSRSRGLATLRAIPPPAPGLEASVASFLIAPFTAPFTSRFTDTAADALRQCLRPPQAADPPPGEARRNTASSWLSFTGCAPQPDHSPVGSPADPAHEWRHRAKPTRAASARPSHHMSHLRVCS